TGRWFALEHWGVRPDILVAAKGASSGYWPFGFAAASAEVYGTVHGRERPVRPWLHLFAFAGGRRGSA
ncbi:MAG TPA: aminotransferase class III-fold pyridoxal phosphate-dependent enzyme, partial [Candidatus Limnocylindrales bacterium]